MTFKTILCFVLFAHIVLAGYAFGKEEEIAIKPYFIAWGGLYACLLLGTVLWL